MNVIEAEVTAHESGSFTAVDPGVLEYVFFGDGLNGQLREVMHRVPNSDVTRIGSVPYVTRKDERGSWILDCAYES